MKKYLITLCLVFSLFILVGCGSKNELVGTWEGETNDGLKTTFIFESGKTVKYDNEYGFDSEGTYEIKDDIVTIKLDSWDASKEYKFEVKDGKLTLTAQDAYSPSYKDMIKK